MDNHMLINPFNSASTYYTLSIKKSNRCKHVCPWPWHPIGHEVTDIFEWPAVNGLYEKVRKYNLILS